MDVQLRTAEKEIARIARGQHGVVTRRQLLDAGLTREVIAQRLERGLLHCVHRGVYRVGHEAPSRLARYMAAALACGPGAVLSGPAAAHLLGLIRRAPKEIEVTATTDRRPKGVRCRQVRRLDRRDVSTCRSIPVTTVPRTLIDLAGLLGEDDLARACHEAGVKYRTTPAQVEAVLDRLPENTTGVAMLRRVMRGEVKVVLSPLEREVRRQLDEYGLELPEFNRPAGGRRVDCRWPRHRLTVEFDSFKYHNSRYSWKQDRRREREAYARGDEFRRFDWDDVFERPDETFRELSRLLAQLDPDRASPHAEKLVSRRPF